MSLASTTSEYGNFSLMITAKGVTPTDTDVRLCWNEKIKGGAACVSGNGKIYQWYDHRSVLQHKMVHGCEWPLLGAFGTKRGLQMSMMVCMIRCMILGIPSFSHPISEEFSFLNQQGENELFLINAT